MESVEWGLVGLSGLKWCPLECSARVGVGLRGWSGIERLERIKPKVEIYNYSITNTKSTKTYYPTQVVVIGSHVNHCCC